MNNHKLACPSSADILDDLLSQPDEQVVQTMRDLEGDIIVLGVGGKMGPTLARMARRASDVAGITRRVVGVSRFSSGELRQQLESWGIETIACDLLDEEAVPQLPDAPNVVYMAGFKFGATANPSLTWAMNCYLPAIVCRRYRNSRITAFSSGNIYGTVAVDSGGAIESTPPNPIGEYAITVLGRERMFDHFSRELMVPISLLRLNYATELRYGVLVDLAQQVFSETPIDVTMGYVNVIWQRDANSMALNSLVHTKSPPHVFNIAGADTLCVREVCTQIARRMNKSVTFTGQEAADALLNNARDSYPLLGSPTTTSEEMIRWAADWVMQGGVSLGKATHFESRSGSF
ncbi:MAG: NAD(P)-dependent oxidoreductase [Planctomycetaceae bacterium]|nr:NAD(P)-dependent oxidoreductase [Planctomycetales bacterium]MCB9921931.1 NAD(P)-dependent oxidoreductase [Planctomycetaceae bacterium]